MKTIHWMGLLLAVLLAGGCARRAERAEGVQLVLTTRELEAGTAFELRFEEAMVRSGLIGAVATNSPLWIWPRVPGRFVWTSSRSGLFTPTEPLMLDTEYELRLQSGLRTAEGQPAKAGLRRLLRTPAFGVVSCSGPEPSTNAWSEPTFSLWFNAEVRAAELGRYAGFTSTEGRWISAEVRQGTVEENGSYRAARTWQEQFRLQRQQPNAGSASHEPAKTSPTNEISNLIVIKPMQALRVGTNWKLVLSPGLPSADGRLRLVNPFAKEIGDVTAFTFEEGTMHHVLGREPYLVLDFSKAVDSALTNSFTNWVQISPWPSGLKARVQNGSLCLAGKWERGTNYEVTLRRGLPATEDFALGSPETLSVEVPPVDPRLYFPAFATEQLAGGGRTYSLLGVNVGQIRVRAKLLDAATAIYALRGYESYFEPRQRPLAEPGEYYRRLDYNLVPGRTVFDERIAGAWQPDVAEEFKLEWDRLLKGRRSGIVFLEAERADADGEAALGTQSLVQLTDLGLVWKTGAAQTRVFVFSYATGQPVANAQVRLCSNENEPLQEALSDGSGQATLQVHTNAAWLVAQAGEDLHAVALNKQNIYPYRFGLPYHWRDGQAEVERRVALFTDRDVYRPGEQVNLKAIARDLVEAGLKIPAGVTGLVVAADARGKTFFRTNVVLSELGACDLAVPLPSAPRGSCSLTLHLDGREHYHQVTLADYQPSAFEILAPAKPAYRPGESIQIPVSARYFFGKPLTQARVRWSLEAQDQPFQPAGFSAFDFARSSVEAQWGRGSSSFAATDDGVLTGRSNCVVDLEVPLNPTAPQPRAATLLVEVTDLNQQTLTRSAGFLQHSSEFYLGLKRFDQVVEAGKPLPIEIALVGADGKPWPEPVSAQLTLRRADWQTTRIQGAGRTARYHSEATFTNVLERTLTVAPPTLRDEEWHGFPAEGLSVPQGGEFLLEVSAQDAGGHEAVASVDFNVTDTTQLAWNYRNDFEIKLVPDKKLYQPGDTALVLVKTPLSGTAWVTVEREGVSRSFTTELDGNAPAVRVPLTAAEVPNAFVSVTLVRGTARSTHAIKEPEYRIGYCQLQVEDPTTRLKVELRPGQTNYLPGATVTVEAQLSDAAGSAVPGAEVTLYAVDEGVLSLTDYAVPDLHAVFFAPRSLDVVSGISLPFLLSEDPEARSFHNKGYLGGGGGRERLRQKFLACAFWNATLRTDAQGKLSARFTAPDGITRYKVMAVAHTAAGQFGSGQSAFAVSKPLLLEPALPRFGNMTDQIQARAVVLNQTDQAGEVLVTLELDDKARPSQSSNLTRTVSVAAHGSAAVEFPLTLVETGPAVWTWHARFTNSPTLNSQLSTLNFAGNSQLSTLNFSDSVRSTLEVGNVLPLLREVALARMESGQTNLLAGINPQLLAGKGTVSVTLANTRLVTLAEAVAQLLHYPYGCVEQTSSSLLPWVLLQQTPELLAFTGRGTNEAAAAARAGVERLLSMQTASGGLSYWPGGKEPMLWGSAYGALVLALARQAGLTVPEKEFASLLEYLSAQLRGQERADWEHCLALYVLGLADRAEPAYCERLFERRERLAAEERALLALAMAKNQADGTALEQLLQTNKVARMATADAFGCSTRETAIRLLAAAASGAKETITANLFDQLERQQQQRHWGTTQGNAWALLAMCEYLRKTEAGLGSCAGTLTWGDTTSAFELGTGCGIYTHDFALTPAAANQSLRLAWPAGKKLFAQVAVATRPPAVSRLQEEHGLSLQRRYDRLNDRNEPEPFEQLRVGDRVLVTLRLTVPKGAKYVAVEDPLPGLFEAVNPEFKTQQTGALPRWLLQEGGDYWWSDFRELRTDRVLFFCDEVQPGNYAIRYVARVRAAGTVTAPSAKAEEMYHPERFGLTETRQITSQSGD